MGWDLGIGVSMFRPCSGRLKTIGVFAPLPCGVAVAPTVFVKIRWLFVCDAMSIILCSCNAVILMHVTALCCSEALVTSSRWM